jgi:Mg-chelatase subunit ChlD
MKTLLNILIPVFLFSFIISCTKTVSDGKSHSPVPETLTDGFGSSGGAAFNDPGNGDSIPYVAGVLTAGEWNDFDHWSFWLGLMNDTFATYQNSWELYCSVQWTINIKDNTNKPVEDALVTIKKSGKPYWTTKTNKFGVTHFIPLFDKNFDATGYTFEVTYSGKTYLPQPLMLSQKNTATFTIPESTQNSLTADLMFVVDATGSMGDEIEYLKNELLDVLNRAGAAAGNISMRYAAVFYRDIGDEYVTRPHNFTSNKNDIVDFVKQQHADGGSDYPEAVDEALQTAVAQNWSDHAHARIMFLILDAPPHEDEAIKQKVRDAIKSIAGKGIMIIPISASGVDKSTEFLLRFMALATNGTYTFLTDDSGIGDSHLVPTIGDYTVEYLNNLMVRLITKYAGN